VSLLDELDEDALRTRLEFYMVSHGIKPARLAREASISRQHLLRVRKGTMEPTRLKIAQIVSALRRLTFLPVQPTDVFELSMEENGTWALAHVRDAAATAGTKFREEMRATTAAIAEVLKRPVAEWPGAFIERGVTEALVRQLVLTAHRLVEKQPKRAIAVLATAERLTKELPTLMKRDVGIVLKGHTYLERAVALRVLGLFHDERAMLDRAEAEFQKRAACTHELAQTWYERAALAFNLNELDEAARLALQARNIFLLTGDRRRAAKARMLQGCVLVDRHQYAKAREEFRVAVTTFRTFGDTETLAAAYLNLGSTEMRMGRTAAARDALKSAAIFFEKAKLPAEVVRVKWNLAHLVTFHESREKGLPLLRKVRVEFAKRDMLDAAATVGLDIVKALFGDDAAVDEAAELCQTIIGEFTKAGAAKNVLTALAYLRDATTRRTASPALVDEVRVFIEHASQDPAATFPAGT
jgi:tetratricopeptide (TPR) repeat protein/DNA-binding phage protein